MKRILLGLLLFGLLELALLVKAGQLFGTFFPIAAVVLSMATGTLLIRHYGFKTVARLSETLRNGGRPAGKSTTGMAGVLAGFLLILPGFLSDLAAILLLIPSARRKVAASLGWWVYSTSVAGSPRPGRQNDGPLIDGEVVEIHIESSSSKASKSTSPWLG